MAYVARGRFLTHMKKRIIHTTIDRIKNFEEYNHLEVLTVVSNMPLRSRKGYETKRRFVWQTSKGKRYAGVYWRELEPVRTPKANIFKSLFKRITKL